MLSLMEVYSMTDLRALITQLCDELDHNRQCLLDDRRLTHPLSDKARAALVETDGPAVSGDREPASVIPQLTQQLYRRAKILFVRKVIDQALRDTASVQWRVADTGEQLVRATDLLAWAEHMEKQMEQLDD